MKRNAKTIQSSLFLTYSIIIITVFIVLVAFFYIWASDQLRTRGLDYIQNLSVSIQEKLDSEIEKMDSISMNTLYSNLVKDRFEKYINSSQAGSGNNPPSEGNPDDINNIKELADTLIAINGPSWSVLQINMFDFNGKVFGAGFDNRQLDMSVQDMGWYDEVRKKNGKKVLTLPYKDEEFTRKIVNGSNRYYLSLCRVFFDKYNRPQGIVEVKQFCDVIFKNIANYMVKSPIQERIYVYDNSGNLVYPFDDSGKDVNPFYNQYFKKDAVNKQYLAVNNPITKERELLQSVYSEYTGWHTVIVISETKLLSPLYSFTRISIFVAFITLLFALLLSFFAAKKLTNPISRLHTAIRSMNLEDIASSAPSELNSGLNELEELNQAFQRMNRKIKKSVEDLLLSQQQEMHSKMLALQSQMNPHFLYNTLATISAMAEEKMDDHIVELCGNISDILRYISSDDSPLVPVTMEIECTEKYLACMKFRHGSKLTYTVELDEGISSVRIPKLVIQPLVENALKYGTHGEPPWNLRILGYINNNYWQIEVQDNGSGFDQSLLDKINGKILEIDRDGVLPSLQLEGMGLLNIYTRLRLTYRSQIIFSMTNRPDGGAAVTIGGCLEKGQGGESNGV